MRFDCKADTIYALQHGLFGNAPRQWGTVAEALKGLGGGPAVVRPRRPGGRCWYDVHLTRWLADNRRLPGFDPDDYYFNEPSDPRAVTLNAEVTRRLGEVELTYATTRQHMRPALRDAPQYASGLRALSIMRHFACDRGREVVEELLDLYPSHVVEFTCMDRPYGTLGWRTVVWEVRSY